MKDKLAQWNNYTVVVAVIKIIDIANKKPVKKKKPNIPLLYFDYSVADFYDGHLSLRGFF